MRSSGPESIERMRKATAWARWLWRRFVLWVRWRAFEWQGTGFPFIVIPYAIASNWSDDGSVFLAMMAILRFMQWLHYRTSPDGLATNAARRGGAFDSFQTYRDLPTGDQRRDKSDG